MSQSKTRADQINFVKNVKAKKVNFSEAAFNKVATTATEATAKKKEKEKEGFANISKATRRSVGRKINGE